MALNLGALEPVIIPLVQGALDTIGFPALQTEINSMADSDEKTLLLSILPAVKVYADAKIAKFGK